MAWKKANPELIHILESQMKKYLCERRMMFGSPTFFINGNMFAGVHEDTIIIRLSESDRKTLFSAYNEVTPFTPMGGRVMQEYAALPANFCRNSELLQVWLEHSFQYARDLPAKPAKQPARKKEL